MTETIKNKDDKISFVILVIGLCLEFVIWNLEFN